MGMTVKELITRLLEEDMDEEVCLQTIDPNFISKENKEGKMLFHIDSVKHWNGGPHINFTDWRTISLYNTPHLEPDSCGNFVVMQPTVKIEAIPKEQYEARLKADMVAMLTEIQLEIEELENPLDYDFEGYNQCAVDCEKIIQQKIDKLKENTDGNDEEN